jgi:hypothetical protein
MGASSPRAKRLHRLFRLTLDDFEVIARHQGGGCAICGSPPKEGKNLHVDHAHDTGLVRGLLCSRDNAALAKFRDNAALLRAAADYLDDPPATAALGAPRYGIRGRVSNKAKTMKRLNPEMFGKKAANDNGRDE